MSSKKRIDDGGPAFPWHSDGMLDHEPPHPGMTLRDYFAAKAMQGLLSATCHPDVNPEDPLDCELTAKYSFRIADAMLAARKR